MVRLNQENEGHSTVQPAVKVEQALDALIIFGTISVGTWIGASFLFNQEWVAALVAFLSIPIILLLLPVLKLPYKVLGRARIRFEQKIFEGVDILVERIYQKFTSFIINIWFKIPRGFKGQYYLRLLHQFYEYEPQGLKTNGPFILEFNKFFVPLKIAPESPQKASSSIISLQKADEDWSLWDILASKSKESINYRCIAIIGSPGCGKTTLLEHITLVYATKQQRHQHPNAINLIPILLYLREAHDTILRQRTSLATLIERQELVEKLNPPPNWFESRLKDGSCLVMLDGLDEIADIMQRQLVSSWIKQQIQNYPKTRFIVTARPGGYNEAPLGKVTKFEVQPFNLNQARNFIHNWYQQKELSIRLGKNTPAVREKAEKKAKNLIARIESNSSIGAMAKNPLLLTMIAIVHDHRGALPGSRVQLYAEICDVLLELRQRSKGLPQTLMPAAQKISVLQVLALILMEKRKLRFELNEADEWIRDRLTTVSRKKITTEEFLKDIEYFSGLLLEKEQGVYEFAHKSLQEYLAAARIKEANRIDVLVSKVNNSWWHETIRLYAAISNANKLVIAAYNAGIVGNIDVLTLAVDCAEEGLRVDQDVREQLELRLDQKCLESENQEIAQLAALVKLTRRLRNLLRLDETTEIDQLCITCAEYQLFLNEKRKSGKNLQPNHWKTDKFPIGDAAKPITGVRSSDALEFCEWLNQRDNTLEFLYRLPTKAEIQAEKKQVSSQKHSIFEVVGYWCQDGEDLLIEGIVPTYWQTLNEKIRNIVEGDLKNLREFIQELDKALVLAQRIGDSLERVHAHARELVEVLERCARGIDSTHARVRDCSRTLQNVRNQVHPDADELSRILRLLNCNYIPVSKSDHQFNNFSFILANNIPFLVDLVAPILNFSQIRSFDITSVRSLINQVTSSREGMGKLISEIRSVYSITDTLIKDLTGTYDFTNRLTSILNLSIEQALIRLRALSAQLKEDWQKALTLDKTRILKEGRNRLHILVQQVEHCCTQTSERDLRLISSHCLSICALWQLPLDIYKRDMLTKQRYQFFGKFKVLNNTIDEHTKKRNIAFDIYIFFAVMNKQEMKELLAWEGIRIVREKAKN